MKTSFVILLLLLSSAAGRADGIPNRLIDYRQFESIVHTTRLQRESHRLTEQQFLQAMRDDGVVLLDARSADKYALRHIKGAIGLPFTDFTAESLAHVIPAKTSKILIYCNNNFTGSPNSFPPKVAAASLNLSTFTALRAYGYENVFELGPLLDSKTTSLPFEGTEVRDR